MNPKNLLAWAQRAAAHIAGNGLGENSLDADHERHDRLYKEALQLGLYVETEDHYVTRERLHEISDGSESMPLEERAMAREILRCRERHNYFVPEKENQSE